MSGYLLETTILVDYFRKKQDAVDLLDNLYEDDNILFVPTIVQAELYYGCRNHKEEEEISVFIDKGYISNVNLSEKVMRKAAEIKRLYGKAYECNLIDILIAASAMTNLASLLTLNEKHFKIIEGLKYEVPY